MEEIFGGRGKTGTKMGKRGLFSERIFEVPQIGMYDYIMPIRVGPPIHPMDLIGKRMDILCRAIDMGIPLSTLLRDECILCDGRKKHKGKTCPVCKGTGKNK